MFINYFKSSHPIVLLLLCVIGVFIWAGPIFIENASYPIFSALPFVQRIIVFFQSHSSLFSALALFFLLLQSIYLNEISIKFNITPKNTYVTALVYFTIMSYLPEAHTFNQIIICNFFLIPMLSLLLRFYEETDAFSEAFYVGMLISLATMFYYPIILLVLFVFFSFIIFRLFSWREWFIVILGMIVPFLFVFTYFFWYNKIPFYFHSWIVVWKSLKIPTTLTNIQIVQYLSYGIILLCSVVFMFSKVSTRTINTRKSIFSILWLFAFAVFLSLFESSNLVALVLLTALPASLLISNYLCYLKNKWLAELIFLCLLCEMILFKFF